jgi:hypothetical protein
MKCIAPGVFAGTTEEWQAEFDNLVYNDPRRRRVYRSRNDSHSEHQAWCPTCGTFMSANSEIGILKALKDHKCSEGG